MSRNLSKQKQPCPETRSTTPVPGDRTDDKGNDGGNRGNYNLKQSEQTYDQAIIAIVLSPTPQHGHDIPSIEPPVVAPFGVNETASHNTSTRKSSGKDSAELASSIHNLGIGNGKIHKPHTYASNDRGDLIPEQRNIQYFKTSKFPVGSLETSYDVPAGSVPENMTKEDQLKWGQGEGIRMNDFHSYFEETLSNEGTEETISGNKPSNNGIDKLPIHKRCTSSNIPCDQRDDIGGMDTNHGLQPWTKGLSKITGGPSAMDTTHSNEEYLSTSSVQLSGLRPTPSAVGQPVTRGDYTPSDAQPDIQVGSAAVAENDRNKSMDNAEKWDTDADFSLNDGAREITDEDCIKLGLYDGWPYKLSDVNTGLPPMTEESWRELETKQTNRRFASDGPSEVDTGRVTAENPSAGTRPLLSIPANVSSLRNLELDEPFKLFDPPEPKPMKQEEAAFDMVDASGHNSVQLSAIPFHAVNSKTGTHSVVDTAAHLTGVPEMNDTASPMKDITKDMPANFGLQKWTGDGSVEQDTKYAKLVSSDSERPESSFETRDVSFMLWTACYPDDPDKARELEASTGVPGIRVYSADVLFYATSNPQIFNEVDASRNSDNSRTEMETQVSPRRPSHE